MAKNAKRSGNPKARAAALAEAATILNPCSHCGKRERSRGGIWCLTCSDSARKRGERNRPTAAMVRACIIGTAQALGIADADGNLVPEAA